MEEVRPNACSPEVGCWELAARVLSRDKQIAYAGSLWTDANLSELKKQSTAGCLLCSLESWQEEDWEDA